MRTASTRLGIADASNLAIAILRKYNENEKFQTYPYLKTNADELSKESKALTLSYMQPRVKSTLESADKDRLNDFKAIKAHITSALYSRDSKKQEAAKKLKVIVDSYKGLSRETYAIKTARIKSLIEDFEREAIASYIEQIDEFSLYLDDLKAHQLAFEKAHDDFQSTKQSKLENASDVKQRVISIINTKILRFLEFKADEEPDTFKEFYDFVESEIAIANATLNKKILQKKEDATTSQTQPTA